MCSWEVPIKKPCVFPFSKQIEYLKNGWDAEMPSIQSNFPAKHNMQINTPCVAWRGEVTGFPRDGSIFSLECKLLLSTRYFPPQVLGGIHTGRVLAFNSQTERFRFDAFSKVDLFFCFLTWQAVLKRHAYGAKYTHLTCSLQQCKTWTFNIICSLCWF